MTNEQQEVYMLLSMSGRVEEAEAYRVKCEAEEQKKN